MVFTAKGTTHKEWLYESGYRLTLIDVVASQLQIETTNFAVCLDISQVFSRFIENVDRFPLSSSPLPFSPALRSRRRVRYFDSRTIYFRPASRYFQPLHLHITVLLPIIPNLSFDSPIFAISNRVFDQRRSFPARGRRTEAALAINKELDIFSARH